MTPDLQPKTANDSRREFIRGSSLLLASALPGQVERGQGVRFGLVGCGRRGQILASAAMAMSDQVASEMRLVAMADILPHRLQQAVRGLKSRGGSAFDASPEGRFTGRDCLQQLVAARHELGLEAVLVATPVRLRASVAHTCSVAGLHTYVEQPVAYDEAGIHRFVEAVSAAERNDALLALGSRHDLLSRYAEICRAIREGIIGEPQELSAWLPRQPAACPARNASCSTRDPASLDQANNEQATLEWTIAVLQLTDWIYGDSWCLDGDLWSSKQTARDARGSEKVYRRASGGQLVIRGCHRSPNETQPGLLLKGSQGNCDLSNGRCWDGNGNLIASLPPTASQRTGQMERVLANLALGHRASSVLEEAQLNHLAIQ